MMEIQIANKHIKMWLSLLVIRGSDNLNNNERLLHTRLVKIKR